MQLRKPKIKEDILDGASGERATDFFWDWDILIEDLKARCLGRILQPTLNCVWNVQLFRALR